MGKFLSDTLYTHIYNIMNSDFDQSVVMELYAGLDSKHQLIICVDYHDHVYPIYNCSTAVIVNPEDSRKMARHHRVRHCDLPGFITDCMTEWSEIINAPVHKVRQCFEEIIDCLIDEGCRLIIKRTYGKDHYSCC